MTARILIADGVATSRITLKVRLSAVCYDVAAVNSTAKIHQELDLARPDLIILGGGFSERPPVDICAELVRDPRCADVPIMMLVPPDSRLAALQAGATAALDPDVDDQILMARVRGLLRETDMPQAAPMGMAEPAAAFVHEVRPLIALVADSHARALRWRQMLAERMNCRFEIRDPDEALGSVTSGRTADLYLISGDLRAKGDGLRLLSELRSRQGSRDAGFVIAIAPDRSELAAIALDLGAGDVLFESLGGAEGADAAAMSLQMLLQRKSRSDKRRAEVQRHMVWAMTDPLTGLYNRRYALPKLGEIVRDALIANHAFAVIAIDLDHFKSINDSHGHSAGDVVLVEIAGRLKAALPSTGMVARMGGEEFLAVLEHCSEAEAHDTAEALRRAIQVRPVALPGLCGGGQVRVTASVGMAVVQPSEEGGWPEQRAQVALERADRALLAAKAAGRNRVMRSQPDWAA